jgi:hypothetical protein
MPRPHIRFAVDTHSADNLLSFAEDYPGIFSATL